MYSDSTYDSTAIVALLGACFLFIVILYAITAFPMMKIFQKAGAPAVAAWVPFWNYWVFFEVAGMKGFWGLLPLLSIIPGVNFIAIPATTVFMTIAAYNIALGFRKDSPALWTVLYFFLAPVWLWILALNGDRWQTVRGTNAILFQEEKYQ